MSFPAGFGMGFVDNSVKTFLNRRVRTTDQGRTFAIRNLSESALTIVPLLVVVSDRNGYERERRVRRHAADLLDRRHGSAAESIRLGPRFRLNGAAPSRRSGRNPTPTRSRRMDTPPHEDEAAS